MRRWFFSRAWRDRELDEEIRAHLAMAVRDRVARGEDPIEAEHAARREFGNVALVKEVTREMWGGLWVERLVQDVRYAVRALRRAPGFTVAVLLTLALGIGANTAIFSVLNAVVLKPLPYPGGERIVYLGWEWARGGWAGTLSPVKLDFARRHSRVFEGITTYRWFSAELGDAVGAGAGAEVQGLRVSEDFLRIFGIQPVLGRGFTAGEDAAGGPSVALIGTGLWRSRFGGDRRVVGRELVLGDERYTIVGVVPTVRLPEAADRAEVLLPLRLVVDPREHGNNYRVVGKLRPGLPSGAVEADLARVMAEFRRAYPEEVQPGDRGLRVMDFRQLFVGQLARTLWILLGSVAFVLLIACANVASLFLARAVGRQREISLRAALGAARGRIVRQLLTEGLVLYLAAGALALALARLALLAAGRTFVSTRLLRAEEIALDGRVLLFTLAVAVVTALVFGAFVAVPASRSDLMRLLREAGAAAGGGGRSARFRRLLVGAESALAVVLLAGAGLLLASLLAVRSVDPRFEARGVVTATLPALPRTYASREAVWDLERRLLERIRAIPGVEGAATTANVPFRRGMNIPITIAGRPDAWEGAAEWRAVSPGYFDALRVGFVRGRDFDARDGAGAPGVVIINESLARRYWPGQDPIGQRIEVGRAEGRAISAELDEPARTVVGVVRDMRDIDLRTSPRRAVFVPRAQAPAAVLGPPAFVIRTEHAERVIPAVRRALHEVDPSLPAPEFGLLSDLVGASLAPDRAVAAVMGAFAAVALLLTAIGIYGVLAYTVRQRTHDIGIRLALGADRGRIVRLIVRQGVAMAGAGMIVGLLASAALTRVLAHMLYGVRPGDPRVYAAVVVTLAAAALLASWLPARRAARLDPSEALRQG